jgi:hypothetical protein
MNPSTGTFISQDAYQGSVYDPVSLHKYLYANANPVMYSDPSGYASSLAKMATVAAIGSILLVASASASQSSSTLGLGIIRDLTSNSYSSFSTDFRYKLNEYQVNSYSSTTDYATWLEEYLVVYFTHDDLIYDPATDGTSESEGEQNEDDTGDIDPPAYPGDDPTKSPGEGWKWTGRENSKPGDKDGNWHNPETGESLRPDLNHPDPVGPHWDYRPSQGKPWYRIFPDGTISPK